MTAFATKLIVAALLLQPLTAVARMTMQTQDQFDAYLTKIERAASSGELDLVEATVVEADNAWETSDPSSLVRLLRAACDQVQSHRFPDQHRARSLTRQWATKAIAKAEKSQLDVQVHLLTSFLAISRSTQAPLGNWAQDRRYSAQLWIGVWQRLEESIDPNWSLNDPKYAIKPYVPPANIPFDSGMRPEDIQDPNIRRQYELHLLKNKELTEFNRQQLIARRLKKEYSETFEDYIVSLYSVEPPDVQRLAQLLAVLKDKGAIERILRAVQNRQSQR